MYFSNIANEELQHFHKTAGADFSMSLTQILSSDLFYKESLGNNIYRIYPMFYCKDIISSNDNDKIIENSCLIVTKQDHETYLSFMAHDEKSNVLIDEDILDIKKIGESLNIDEFNALVYRLRKLGVINGHLNFEEINNIAGEYGNYIFNNIKGQLKNDVGIIVNNEIKNNPITVKLENPFFLDAKYVLTFTVTSLTGANICEEESEDFKTIETIDIELVEGSEVSIDLTNYTNDSVLLFDFTVAISFDTPEIVNANFDLNIVSNKERISLGEEMVLTATLFSDDNVSGYTVEFFEDNISIGTKATDSEGIANLTYAPQKSTNHVYSCSVLGIIKTVNVLVYNKNTKLSLDISSNSIRVDNEITLTAVLSDHDDNVLDNMLVKVYENNNLIDTLTTDNEGQFTKTIAHNACNDYIYNVVYEGSDGYLSATSNIVRLNVYKYSTTITLSGPNTVYVPNYFTVSGNLKKEQESFENANVNLYNEDNLIATLTTDSNGDFSKSIYINVPKIYKLKAVYEGNDKIAKSSTNAVTVNARKIKTYISCTPSKSVVYPNETISLTGSITDEFGNVLAGRRIITLNGTYQGYYTSPYSFNVTVSNLGNNQYTVAHESGYVDGAWVGPDHAKYEDCKSSPAIVRCIKYPVSVNILDNEEDYDCGENILIEVTSEDSNFNPNSINVTFNGVSSTVTTKDNNGRFIYTIPNVDVFNGVFNIYANINEDGIHEAASDVKTITVYKKLQHLIISKSGNNLVIVGKDRNNQITPHEILNGVTVHYNSNNFIIENQIELDDNGIATINLTNWGIQGSIYVVSNGITSNKINW